MAKRFKVAEGCSCIDQNRKLMYPGTVFKVVERQQSVKGKVTKYPPQTVIQTAVDDWLKSGHCVPLKDGEESVPDLNSDQNSRVEPMTLKAPNNVPGIDIPAQVTTAVGEAGVQEGGGPAIPPGVAPHPAANKPVQDPIVTPVSPWVFDPNALKGMTVEAANAMIAERISPAEKEAFTPYVTVEDAVKHLSKDFQNAVQVARQE